MTGWHVTTPRKLARYRTSGAIWPPVRFWLSKETAERWMQRVGRSIILRIEAPEAFPMHDHRPHGMAWWSPNVVREFEPEPK